MSGSASFAAAFAQAVVRERPRLDLDATSTSARFAVAFARAVVRELRPRLDLDAMSGSASFAAAFAQAVVRELRPRLDLDATSTSARFAVAFARAVVRELWPRLDLDATSASPRFAVAHKLSVRNRRRAIPTADVLRYFGDALRAASPVTRDLASANRGTPLPRWTSEVDVGTTSSEDFRTSWTQAGCCTSALSMVARKTWKQAP
ncbi:hypothetical protein MTO96_015320 [Rhipicephalus appendiculatus]